MQRLHDPVARVPLNEVYVHIPSHSLVSTSFAMHQRAWPSFNNCFRRALHLSRPLPSFAQQGSAQPGCFLIVTFLGLFLRPLGLNMSAILVGMPFLCL